MRHFAVAAVVGLAGLAQADTIATFADPAASGATPLFKLENNVLSGSWSGSGLMLHTPGLASPDFADATFNMAPVALTSPLPLAFVGAGSIDFFDSSSNHLMTISWSSAFLTSALSFGASEFTGFDVTFSGPVITSPLTDESFSFSFANPQSIQGGFTVTSSFTSSATVIPAPGAIALLGAAGLVARRRR